MRFLACALALLSAAALACAFSSPAAAGGGFAQTMTGRGMATACAQPDLSSGPATTTPTGLLASPVHPGGRCEGVCPGSPETPWVTSDILSAARARSAALARSIERTVLALAGGL